METLQNNELSVIEKSIDVLKSGPAILEKNTSRKEKAIAVGINILAAIEQEGMTPELDERAKNYLVNIGAALKSMKEERAAVTQIMDALKKMFTEIENDLDSKKSGTIPSKIQLSRDAYAKELAEAARIAEEKRQAEIAKTNEEIILKAAVTTDLNNTYFDLLSKKKQDIIHAFNAITLFDFEEKKNRLIELVPNVSVLNNLSVSAYPSLKYITSDSVVTIYNQVKSEFIQSITANYIAEINLLKDELVDKLPSKLAELKEEKRLADEAAKAAEAARIAEEKRQAEIVKANEEQRARLEKEATIARESECKRREELKAQQEAADAERKRREEEEEMRIAQENEESKRIAQQEIEIKKQGEQTMALFENEAAIPSTDAPESRWDYEINVLHPAGYVQIFQFWFENEGKNLPVDKIGNTKLEQAKSWVEKYAKKTGTKIESKFLKYYEVFKAVNRKTK